MREEVSKETVKKVPNHVTQQIHEWLFGTVLKQFPKQVAEK